MISQTTQLCLGDFKDDGAKSLKSVEGQNKKTLGENKSLYSNFYIYITLFEQFAVIPAYHQTDLFKSQISAQIIWVTFLCTQTNRFTFKHLVSYIMEKI